MNTDHISSPTGNFFFRMLCQSLILTFLAVIAALGSNFLHPEGLPLPGDWSPESRMVLENGENIAIPLKEARQLSDEGKAFFLDARPPEQYAQGHIRGARNLPPDQFDGYFDKLMPEIPEDSMLITYCDGESCHLSKELAQILKDLGYSNVRVLVNGWSLWKQGGFPIESASSE